MQLFETGGVVGREVVVGCGGPARVRAVGGSFPRWGSCRGGAATQRGLDWGRCTTRDGLQDASWLNDNTSSVPRQGTSCAHAEAPTSPTRERSAHSTRNQVMRILEKNPGVVPAHPNHPRGSPDGYWVKFSVFSARCREFLPNLVSRSCQTRLRTLSVDRGGERARAHGHGVASKSPTTSGATSCGARKRQSTFPAPSR